MTWHHQVAKLQDLDLRKARLSSRLIEIDEILASSVELDEAHEELKRLQEEQASRATRQRAAEAAVHDVQARISQEEGRLYDGSVKAPKELASLQEEVAHLRESLSGREDTLMTILVEADEADSAIAAQTATVERLTAERQALERDLGAEAEAARAEITAIETEVAALRGALPPSTVRLYDDLARRKAGIGVAVLKGSLCGTCRVSAPDSVRRRTADPDQVVQCPNCERILIPDP